MSEQEKIQTEEESIGKIRDILFGNNISEIDKRFNEQENQFLHRLEKTVGEFQEKINHIQNHFQNEIEEINKQIKVDRDENKRMNDLLFGKIDEIWENINQFKEETANNHRDIRKNQLDQFNQLDGRLTEINNEIRNALEQKTRQLGEAKVDRKSLALMFSQLALNLDGGEENTTE